MYEIEELIDLELHVLFYNQLIDKYGEKSAIKIYEEELALEEEQDDFHFIDWIKRYENKLSMKINDLLSVLYHTDIEIKELVTFSKKLITKYPKDEIFVYIWFVYKNSKLNTEEYFDADITEFYNEIFMKYDFFVKNKDFFKILNNLSIFFEPENKSLRELSIPIFEKASVKYSEIFEFHQILAMLYYKTTKYNKLLQFADKSIRDIKKIWDKSKYTTSGYSKCFLAYNSVKIYRAEMNYDLKKYDDALSDCNSVIEDLPKEYDRKGKLTKNNALNYSGNAFFIALSIYIELNNEKKINRLMEVIINGGEWGYTENEKKKYLKAIEYIIKKKENFYLIEEDGIFCDNVNNDNNIEPLKFANKTAEQIISEYDKIVKNEIKSIFPKEEQVHVYNKVEKLKSMLYSEEDNMFIFTKKQGTLLGYFTYKIKNYQSLKKAILNDKQLSKLKKSIDIIDVIYKLGKLISDKNTFIDIEEITKTEGTFIQLRKQYPKSVLLAMAWMKYMITKIERGIITIENDDLYSEIFKYDDNIDYLEEFFSELDFLDLFEKGSKIITPQILFKFQTKVLNNYSNNLSMRKKNVSIYWLSGQLNKAVIEITKIISDFNLDKNSDTYLNLIDNRIEINYQLKKYDDVLQDIDFLIQTKLKKIEAVDKSDEFYFLHVHALLDPVFMKISIDIKKNNTKEASKYYNIISQYIQYAKDTYIDKMKNLYPEVITLVQKDN